MEVVIRVVVGLTGVVTGQTVVLKTMVSVVRVGVLGQLVTVGGH